MSHAQDLPMSLGTDCTAPERSSALAWLGACLILLSVLVGWGPLPVDVHGGPR